mgnify:CR=1 FL=1
MDMHRKTLLQNDKRFSALRDFIALGIKQVISHNKYRDVDIVISNAWANVNRYRDFNDIHQHPGVHWSGVYYVDGPENSGPIRGAPCANPLLRHCSSQQVRRRR